MLTLAEIVELRATLDAARIEVTGRTKAFNLVAIYQALDREEAIARTPVEPEPNTAVKDA